jgi:hypothetical protein
MVTGAEAAVKDANKQEREEATTARAEIQRLAKIVKIQTSEALAEAEIDDDLLAGIASSEDETESVELIFSTPISPSRGTMGPLL